MEIKDNGKAFHVKRVLLARRNRRLGLLGMRERVEMVDGRFTVESAPGKGTTIRAQIPFSNRTRPAKTCRSNPAGTRTLNVHEANHRSAGGRSHRSSARGFGRCWKHEDDIEVVGEAETGRQAVQLTRKLRPAVVVMDIAMPLLNGLEATRQILKEFPATKVLILSAHSDDAYVEQVIAMGAAGYLIKQTSAQSLSKAIREVHKGNTFFSPSISKRLNDRDQNRRIAGNGPRRRHQPDFARGGDTPTDCRRKGQQANRGGTRHQHQDGRETSAASHEQAGHPRHRRSHPLRHRRGDHREQRPVNDHLADGCAFLTIALSLVLRDKC